MSLELFSVFVSYLVSRMLSTLPSLLALAALFTLISVATIRCNPGPSWWRKPDLLTDLAYHFILPLVSDFGGVILLIFGAIILTGSTNAGELKNFVSRGHGPLSGLSFWVQFPAYFILTDLIMYWTHRAFHTASLWRYHAIHHASKHLEWISAERFHPINTIFHGTLANVSMLFIGIAPDVMIAAVPLVVGTSALVHANLNWDFGPFRSVVASPIFHRWHHTGPDRGGSKNFAPTFPFIDRLFGTYYMPVGELPDRYGIDDPEFPPGFLQQVLYPFRRRDRARIAADRAGLAEPRNL